MGPDGTPAAKVARDIRCRERIQAWAGTNFSYDANGNQVSKTKAGVETRFLFDIRNQLGEVQQGTSILGRYGYDHEGRRILKIGAEGRRHYTYDQKSVVTETDQAGVERPMSTSYQAKVHLDDPDGLMRIGLRGRAKIHAAPQTLGQRIARMFNQLINFKL